MPICAHVFGANAANHVPGSNAANAARNLDSGPVPREPALSAAVEAIFRRVDEARATAHQINAAVGRLVPPIPVEEGIKVREVEDASLLSALAAVENRLAVLAQTLEQMATQLDRAI